MCLSSLKRNFVSLFHNSATFWTKSLLPYRLRKPCYSNNCRIFATGEMKGISSIKLKATFLLTVFGLNTVVGFACAMGLDMSINTSQHETEANKIPIHIHADGKKHHHQQEPVTSTHVHTNGKKHKHNNEQATENQDEKETSKKDKDGCCNDDIFKFQSLDKALNAKTGIDATVLVTLVSSFLRIDICKEPAVPTLHTNRYLFPPPPDILTNIQRFQI